MDTRKYYEAYDDRYTQVHSQQLRWFTDCPSPIVGDIITAFGIRKDQRLLEIGCGEGRDAAPLLAQGYDLLATDVSPAAIAYCGAHLPEYTHRFQVLDCISGTLAEKFDFIYAVAVIHMLVEDRDRMGFYRFIRDHLSPGGIALIGTMGDGTIQRQSDISTAFELQERVHEPTGRIVRTAGTSCRMVDFGTFRRELRENGLHILREGITAVEPDFPQMMYAVVN